jgi:endonuclease/exonuclease/phosphatase family metal-dependent hydrolase
MRIVSWNVHGFRGAGGRRDLARAARVLADLAPDLAGLQEVEGEGPGDDPALALGAALGLSAAFGPTLTRAGRPYGNAVLSRFPVEATRRYDLSVPGREPRGCLRADVRAPGTRVHVFAVHLGLGGRERERQAGRLLSADILRDAALSYPLVLLGDFNEWSRRSAVPRWLRRELADCAVEAGRVRPTFPARFPLLRLDRAFVSGAFRVLGCEVVRTREARGASDHLPIVAELELLPSARRPPATRPVEAEGVRTEVRETPR